VRSLALIVASACTFQANAARDAGSGSAPGSDSAWWDTAWTERIPLVITNGSSATLDEGFEVGFAFDVTAAPCASTGSTHDDIRIVNGTTDLPRVIDDVGPPVWIWFRLEAALAGGSSVGGYDLYCDNPAAGSASADPATVFDFYDSFDTLGSAWMQGNNTTAADGVLVCPGDGIVNSGVVSVMTYPANTAVDFVATAAGANGFWWGGFQNGTSNAQPWVLWYANMDPQHLAASLAAADPAQIQNGSEVPQDTAAHLYGVELYGQVAMYRFGDTPVTTIANGSSQPLPATFSVRLWNGGGVSNATIDFDSVRVRHAVSPVPTVETGSAEHLRGT
jgi:hypothetical protein